MRIAFLVTIVLLAASPALANPLFSPYLGVDDRVLADPTTALRDSNPDEIHLAFIGAKLANDDPATYECKAVWDRANENPISNPDHPYRAIVSTLNTKAILSFGGSSSENALWRLCKDTGSLAKQIVESAETLKVGRIDLDVEEGWTEGIPKLSPEEVQRVAQAVPHIRTTKGINFLSLTLSASTESVTYLGALLEGNCEHVDRVNLMTMNYGTDPKDPARDPVRPDWATLVSKSIIAARSGIASICQKARKKPAIGIVLLIGRNDILPDLRPEGVVAAVKAAAEKKVHSVAMWNLNRDKPCPKNPTQQGADWECHGIEGLEPGTFSRLIGQTLRQPNAPSPR